MVTPVLCRSVATFRSPLGWIALAGREEQLSCVSFGHASEAAALAAVRDLLAEEIEPSRWNPRLNTLLQAYAEGVQVDFDEVAIDEDHLTTFARRVVRHCRRVRYGQTISYGELARRAGAPGAARAVGHVMATNRYPLVVPCHRIVAAHAGLGGYSAPGGTQVKQRLLAMEATGAAAALNRARRAVDTMAEVF